MPSPMLELQRHTRRTPCPVCGGHAGLASGRSIRCAGFTLSAVAYCTREELSGPIAIDQTSPPAYRHRLVGACACGTPHGHGLAPTRRMSPPVRAHTATNASPAERDAIYREALLRLDLRAEAATDLTRRGLTAAQVASSLFRSLPRKGHQLEEFMKGMIDAVGPTALAGCPGFTDKNGRLTFRSALGPRDGYLVPYLGRSGEVTGMQVKYPGGRYETLLGSRIGDIYHLAGRPQRDLYLTEGGLKAEVASALGGYWVMGVPGQSLQANHIEVLRELKALRVIVALDREENENTDRARERWLDMLWSAGLPVHEAVWEGVAA